MLNCCVTKEWVLHWHWLSAVQCAASLPTYPPTISTTQHNSTRSTEPSLLSLCSWRKSRFILLSRISWDIIVILETFKSIALFCQSSAGVRMNLKIHFDQYPLTRSQHIFLNVTNSGIIRSSYKEVWRLSSLSADDRRKAAKH